MQDGDLAFRKVFFLPTARKPPRHFEQDPASRGSSQPKYEAPEMTFVKCIATLIDYAQCHC